MKLTVPLYRACVVGLAMFMALTFTALEPHVVGQQSTSRIDRAVVRETVESVASVVIREYFDVSVGARVDASLRQWLYEGRYANAETLESLAAMLTRDSRAEVIGERTAGAANPGRPYAVSAGLELTVPNGQVRAAVSGRNWEGVGVIPDLSVTASDALRVGHIRALRGLLQQAPSGLWHEALKRQIAALEERR